MAYGALFIGWGPARDGREQQAFAVFGELIQYLSGLQERGEIDSFEPVALEPHGGDLDGFALVRGAPERLSRLRGSADFIRLTTRGALVVTNLGVVGAMTGDDLNQLFGDFQAHAQELAGGGRS